MGNLNAIALNEVAQKHSRLFSRLLFTAYESDRYRGNGPDGETVVQRRVRL